MVKLTMHALEQMNTQSTRARKPIHCGERRAGAATHLSTQRGLSHTMDTLRWLATPGLLRPAAAAAIRAACSTLAGMLQRWTRAAAHPSALLLALPRVFHTDAGSAPMVFRPTKAQRVPGVVFSMARNARTSSRAVSTCLLEPSRQSQPNGSQMSARRTNPAAMMATCMS